MIRGQRLSVVSLVLALIAFAALSLAVHAAGAQRVVLQLANPLNEARPEEPIVYPVEELKLAGLAEGAIVVRDESAAIVPSQADDLDGDGDPDELVFLLDFAANQTRKVFIAREQALPPPFQKRTHARMSLRTPEGKIEPRQVVHSESGNMWNQVEHHGPALESELTGWRIYFDEKSAIDIYSKRRFRLELEKTRWYYPPKESRQDWGGDFFYVGQSLGVGSVRGLRDGRPVMINDVTGRTARIVAAGPLRAILEMTAEGWKCDGSRVDITSRLSICAGQRWMEHSVIIGGDAGGPELCTGLVRYGHVPLHGSAAEGWIATWGWQNPKPPAKGPGVQLGIAVVFPEGIAKGLTAGERSHVVTLTPIPGQRLRFYITSAWEQEQEGIRTLGEFLEHVRELKRRVDNPIAATLATPNTR